MSSPLRQLSWKAVISRGPAEEVEAAAARRLCSRLVLICRAARAPAESAGGGSATARRLRPVCFALLYQQAQMPFKKFTGSPDEQNAQEGGRVRGREERERDEENEREREEKKREIFRVGTQSSLMRSVILAHFIPT